MLVAPHVEKYLNKTHAHYEVIHHAYTTSAYDSARSMHIPAKNVAKAILLRDMNDGKYVVAVIPANHKIVLLAVNNELNREFTLAEESELTNVFDDCSLGAVPGLAQAYGLEVIWDDTLLKQKNLYFEAGNHEDMIHLDHKTFSQLFEHLPHAEISSEREIKMDFYRPDSWYDGIY